MGGVWVKQRAAYGEYEVKLEKRKMVEIVLEEGQRRNGLSEKMNPRIWKTLRDHQDQRLEGL